MCMDDLKTAKEIELRSEEVQEIMNQIPSWIVRRGVSVLFFVIISLLVGSYFFKYPDVLNAEITITAAEPPVNIVARSSGKLDTIFARNQEQVGENTPLAAIQNPAQTEDILYLLRSLQNWKESEYNIGNAEALFERKSLSLGAVQSAYAVFLSSLKEYKNYIKLNYFTKKIAVQKEKIIKLREYYEKVFKQQQLVDGKQSLSKASFERDSVLYVKNIISRDEYEKSRTTLLQNKQSHLSFNASLKQTELQLIQGKENLIDLQQRAMEAEQKYTLTLQNSLENLIAQLETWEQQYLLEAPIEGIVNQMGVWSSNQNVQSGEIIFTVTPIKNTAAQGKALLPVQGAGKVKVGQRVNVRVNNFPDQEFGYLEGRVASISRIPTAEGFYVLSIDFPEGLETNYHKELPKTGEMKGVAEIITEDLRLIERFFMPIKKVIANRM